MKRFEERTIRALPTNTILKPAPFAGTQWPTRIFWRVDFKEGKFETYNGKPSRNALTRYFKLAKKQNVVGIFATEYDRASQVRMFSYKGRMRQQPLRPTAYSVNLCTAYHPWEDWGADVLANFLRPIFVKKLRTNVGVLRVYSPHERLSLSKHIEPYRSQMKACYGDAATLKKTKPMFTQQVRPRTGRNPVGVQGNQG